MNKESFLYSLSRSENRPKGRSCTFAAELLRNLGVSNLGPQVSAEGIETFDIENETRTLPSPIHTFKLSEYGVPSGSLISALFIEKDGRFGTLRAAMCWRSVDFLTP